MDPDVKVAGVIFNRVGSGAHTQRLKDAVDAVRAIRCGNRAPRRERRPLVCGPVCQHAAAPVETTRSAGRARREPDRLSTPQNLTVNKSPLKSPF